jgi:hypothetical protein
MTYFTAGDIITHINGIDVRGGKRKPHGISKMLRGLPGMRVTLTVQRGSAILTIHVVRGHGLDREFVGAYRKALAVQRSLWMRKQDGATLITPSRAHDGTAHTSTRTRDGATLLAPSTVTQAVAPPSSSFAAVSVSESELQQKSRTVSVSESESQQTSRRRYAITC